MKQQTNHIKTLSLDVKVINQCGYKININNMIFNKLTKIQLKKI